MADEFFKWMSGKGEGEDGKTRYAIAPGIVENIIDLLGEARVEVRIPTRPGLSPQARLVSTAGSGGSGFFWLPKIKDEVLVAFNQNDLLDAYILGGLWSTLKRPPLITPFEQATKRVIMTGLGLGFGHQIEFDDFSQSITITSSTKDKIVIGPLIIEISTYLGPKITLSNVPPTISIEGAGSIELKAGGKISLEAGGVIDIKAGGICSLTGSVVKIN